MSAAGAVVKILLAPERGALQMGANKVFFSPTVLCNLLMQVLGNLDYL